MIPTSRVLPALMLGGALLVGLESIGQSATDAQGDPLPTGARLRLGSIRFRCAGNITALAYSPDGRILALAGTDRTIRFWDPATGKEIRTLSGHEDAVTSIAFSADGKVLVSGSYDRTVRLWDVASGQLLHKLNADNGWVTAVALSPDGKTVAAGGRHRALHVWDVATQQELWKVTRPMWVTSLVFDRDGKRLASASKYDGLRVWEVGTGQEFAKLEGHEGNVHSLALTLDGQTLASAGSDRTVRLWELSSGKEVRKLEGHRGPIYSLQFLTDGQTLVSGSADGTLRLWETSSGKERLALPTGRGEVVAIALAPDGRSLASAGLQSQVIQLWDLATGKDRGAPSGHGAGITTIAFSPDGTTLASGSRDHSVRLWDLKTGEERRALEGHDTSIHALAFAPDGKTLASTAQRRQARLWEAASGKGLPSLDTEDWVLGFTFGADGQARAWTTGPLRDNAAMRFAYTGMPQMIQLIDWTSGKPLHTLKPDFTPGPGGGMIVFVPQQQPTAPAHVQPVGSIAYAPRRDLVASGSHDKTIGLWRLQTGKFLARLDGHAGAVSRVLFSADDRILASIGDDRTIRVWEVATYRLIRKIAPQPEGDVRAIALSPEGRLLAWAGGTDQLIHLVDLAGSAPERTLTGHSGLVAALAFAPHGRWLASGSDDTTTLVWDVAAPPVAKRPPLTADELDKLWNGLANGEDAMGVYESFGDLLAAPEQAVPFFKERLKEGRKVKPIAQLITELDDGQFPVRTRAFEELHNLGDLARADILKAIDGKPSLEVRQRLDDLLRLLDQRQGRPSPDELRQIRSVQVLEWLGRAPARELLEELAKGSPTMWQTQEAKAALQRLRNAQAP